MALRGIVRPGILRALCVAVLLCGATGCRSITTIGGDNAIAVDRPGRIPPSAFFADETFSVAALSPDGERLALLRSTGTEDAIVVRPLSGEGEERILVREVRKARGTAASRGIRVLGWAGDGILVYSVQSPMRVTEDWDELPVGNGERGNFRKKGGVGIRSRKTRLFAVDLDGGETRYLAKNWQSQQQSGIQDAIIDWLPREPDHFLLDFRGRAVRVRASSGATRVVAKDQDETARWFSDREGRVRAGLDFDRWSTVRTLRARVPEDESWRVLDRFDPYIEKGTGFAGFSRAVDGIYVYSNRATGRAALHAWDLTSNSAGAMLVDDPQYDVDTGRLIYSARDGRALALTYYQDRLRRVFLDPEWEGQWSVVDEAFPDQDARVAGSSADGRRVLLSVSSDRSPPTLHLFEPETGRLSHLLSKHPSLAGVDLARTEPVEFEARDGLTIHGYLTRPPGASDVSGPTIVYPHDGPANRDVIRWDPIVQFLASRGFTVFQLDYRGSVGHGWDHERAGDRQWGRGIQDDVTDGVDWLVAQGIADPDRIGIFGTGFGGYVALMGLIETPGLFRAGASFGAPTDLGLVLSNGSIYPRRKARDVRMIGTGEDRLEEVSPALQAGRIRAPVLLAHGTEDPIYHPDHLEEMVDALDDAGVAAESYRYSGAVQYFLDERQRVDFFSRLALFFEREL